MKVVSYKNVVPVKNQSQEKFDILTKYVKGVNACGDQGLYYVGNNPVDCDVAVIQGWQHEKGKTAPHLQLRQNIIDYQKSKNKYTCVADSNLFLYATKENHPHHYLRYSFNGVFPSNGIYFDDKPDPKRWQQIKTDLNLQVENIKNNGSHILLCLQRNGGWSMGKTDLIEWIHYIHGKVRKHSSRHIIIRPHPKDYKSPEYLKTLNFKKLSNTSVSYNKTFEEDLQNTWAVINHNSSSIVGPIIKGYHAFVTDPENSQCREVVNTDLRSIENPNIYDRQGWLERISMFHWKFDELEDGSAWRHMRNYVRQ